MKLIGISLVSLTCIGIAGYLVINDKGDWGWFLFVGLICAGYAVFKKD